MTKWLKGFAVVAAICLSLVLTLAFAQDKAKPVAGELLFRQPQGM
jgi:hypothetical protein